MTNDIFTREDQEFLIRNEALPAERIRAIETGGCPHAAIREDISANLHALEQLQVDFETQLLFVESGGDNLAGEGRFPDALGLRGRTRRGRCGGRWESGPSESRSSRSSAGESVDDEEDDEIVFDSGDEDECEDLFSGTWDPAAVRKRRQRKIARKIRVTETTSVPAE